MNFSRHSLAVVLLATSTAFAAPPSGQSYRLVFGDEFSAPTLDNFKWNFGYPWGSGRTHNHSGYADLSQVQFNNGILTLGAVGQRHPNAVNFTHDQFGYQSVDYTVGVINTQGKLNINEGYIEASMKLNGSIGAWPAFWMLGNGWPPEIDIMEFPRGTSGGLANNNNTYMMNYHYVNGSGSNASYYKRDTGIPFELTGGFHTYALEWTPSVMRFSIDGLVRHTITDSAAIADAVNMYMLLNNGVDGWADTPSNPSGYNAPFQIDYVRVYQRNTNASATTTWKGTTTAGNWDTSANWTQAVPRYADLTAVWNTMAQSSLSVGWTNSRTVGGLRFNTNATVVLGSSTSSLQLASSGAYATIESTSANTSNITIASRLDLWSDTRVINNSTNPLMITGRIVGDGSFLKGGTGMVQLLSGNTLTGGVGFYGGTNSGDAGVLRLSNSYALGNLTFSMPGSNNASQIVELTGFIDVANDLTTAGRSQPIFLRNAGGVNTWAGDLIISNAGGAYAIDAASGTLNLAGTLTTSMSSAPSSRIFTLQGLAVGNLSGNVVDGRDVPVGVAKDGTGTWTIHNANLYSAGTTVNDGTLLAKHARSLGTGPITLVGGKLDFQAGLAEAVVVPSLTLDAGTLEIRDNAIVIDATPQALPTALADLRADLLAGLITSDVTAGDPRLAIAYASADTIGMTSVRNVMLDTDAIVLLAGLRGDTNLDASIDFGDLLTLAQGYGTSERLWTDGDFTYDGAIDFGDLLALAQNYGATLSSVDVTGFSADFRSDLALAMSLVPEPACLSLLAIGAGLTRRRP